MRQRAVPLIITLAILAPGLIAGIVVGGFVADHHNHRHSAPLPVARQQTVMRIYHA